MKIIVATPLYPPEVDNIAIYVKEVAERLRNKEDIVIAAYVSTAEKIPGVTLLTTDKRRPLPVRLFQYTIMLFKASRNADIIYAQNAVAVGLPAIIVHWLLKIPVVLNFTEDESWKRAKNLHLTNQPFKEFLNLPQANLKIRLIMRLQGWILRRASIIITPSRALANLITAAYLIRPARVFINYRPPEKPEILPFNIQPVPHQIIAAGPLVKWTGIAAIIRAAALLKKEFPDVRLLIAGNGPEKTNLKELAQKLGISNYVIFLGYVSRPENWYIRKTSQVYTHNYISQDLSGTILTSFSAQTPVIAAKTPATNEIISHGQTGLLVKPDDEKEIAQEIARIFKDETLRAKIIDGMRKTLDEKLSWNNHIRKLVNLFESIQKNNYASKQS